jgi:ABC-type oligopeptide transport system ATPase subunit
LSATRSVSALDVSVQAQVNLLSDLKREFGITYLISLWGCPWYGL